MVTYIKSPNKNPANRPPELGPLRLEGGKLHLTEDPVAI